MYTIMLVILGLPKCIIFVLRPHLCGGVTSTFVLSGSHFCPPCVGRVFPLILDLLGMSASSPPRLLIPIKLNCH